MIDFLDSILRTLLAGQETGLDASRLYFDTPDEKFAPSPPAINLFLYDVRENQGLRRNEPVVNRGSNSTVTKNLPPVYVDCSYLITAWAGDINSEHKLLGTVMAVLLRYPVIPKNALPTDPMNPLTQMENHLVTSALRPGHLQSMAEFWQVLGGKPKAALHLTVTMPVLPPAGVAGQPVKVAKVYIDQGGGKYAEEKGNYPEGQVSVIEGHKPPVNQQ